MASSSAAGRRIRLEVIVEQAYLERVTVILDQGGMQGYTVLPCMSGKGTRGTWTPEGAANARVMIVAVGKDDAAEDTAEMLRQLFDEIPGVAFLSEVDAVRPLRA
ncbi:MAG: hypothetical protein HC923_08005 [Myxococcales bacterium]|nr:hypothetical protein [Myxococcales bacterium]